MNSDFHYYATYCAAQLAGYSHDESADICYSAQLVDLCSKTFLNKLKAPAAAATTQLQLELMETRTDILGLQDITRIWSSFHFLPRDLHAEKEKCSKEYRSKYRLICGPNSELVTETVRLAKDKGSQAAGVAMHVLADTWAHTYFAGTPSFVINNTNYHFFEIFPDGDKKIKFRHSASAPDDLDKSLYTSSLMQPSENSIMNLGHGRAGHLPDYSFIRYRYLPAWGDYDEIIKDNPSDYIHAFAQMVYALQYLRGLHDDFETEVYAWDTIAEKRSEIEEIIRKRRLDASDDWKALGESLSGQIIPDFELDRYNTEYLNAGSATSDTFIGKFIIAAMAQKSMVTNRIFTSGNLLAGISIDYIKSGFHGIKDYARLIEERRKLSDKVSTDR